MIVSDHCERIAHESSYQRKDRAEFFRLRFTRLPRYRKITYLSASNAALARNRFPVEFHLVCLAFRQWINRVAGRMCFGCVILKHPPEFAEPLVTTHPGWCTANPKESKQHDNLADSGVWGLRLSRHSLVPCAGAPVTTQRRDDHFR